MTSRCLQSTLAYRGCWGRGTEGRKDGRKKGRKESSGSRMCCVWRRRKRPDCKKVRRVRKEGADLKRIEVEGGSHQREKRWERSHKWCWNMTSHWLTDWDSPGNQPSERLEATLSVLGFLTGRLITIRDALSLYVFVCECVSVGVVCVHD